MQHKLNSPIHAIKFAKS